MLAQLNAILTARAPHRAPARPVTSGGQAIAAPQQRLAFDEPACAPDAVAIGSRRVILLIFLPFAAGYYLSYLYRTINALIAAQLTASMPLGASDLGLLTAVYFLSFAAVQLPIGIALDRYGPRRVQGVLLFAAAVGAALFGSAHSLPALIAGRALIGFGVAGSLIAGLKALVLWFPKERLPFFNGCFVMLGALGAVTATAPAEQLVDTIGWRGLFALLAAATAGCAAAILVLSPKDARPLPRAQHGLASLRLIYRDQRFWRLAPLSTLCISTAWSLQGLWAAPWLADVERLEHPAIVRHLLVMALALCAGAFLFGVAADRLRRLGVRTEFVLAAVGLAFTAALLALALHLPLSSYVVWAILASVGAATVLSYAILIEYFPSEIAGQANAALNLFHIGGAFVLQYAIGLIINVWNSTNAHYPPAAYETAIGIILCLQVAALCWFVGGGRLISYIKLQRSRPSPMRLPKKKWLSTKDSRTDFIDAGLLF
jgi:MFS family permease